MYKGLLLLSSLSLPGLGGVGHCCAWHVRVPLGAAGFKESVVILWL
jgi:hypothetical protein